MTVAMILVTAFVLAISGRALEVGAGWRILNYASFSFPVDVTSDLRWIGARARIGNSVFGIGFSIDSSPVPFLESLIPIAPLFGSDNYVYVTTGATIVDWSAPGLWPLGNGWSMRPWIGVETDIVRIRWLNVTAKVEFYIPRNSLPDKVGIGFIAHLYPLRTE
jgi:hypothetical protein